ncbi:MAG: LPS export ABC transporter periplasmic protein LptC [Pseudomonadota bacterium]
MAVTDPNGLRLQSAAPRHARADAPARRGHGLPLPRLEDRAKAYRAARRHTALVRVLRVVFPVVAVGTFGLYAVNAKFSVDIGDATASVERIELTQDALRMVTPRLEGVTQDNGRYVVQAKSGVQDADAPDIINLDAVDARVARPGNQWVHLVADNGRFETKADRMQLAGNIRIVADNGMDAQLSTANIDIKTNTIVSGDPVNIQMPNGTIDSASIAINTEARTVSFVGDVRVTLFKQPQSPNAASAAAPQTE